jgi:hypothetical protein
MQHLPKLVTCPLCKRQIRLDALGGVNMDGERVMQWHLAKTRPHHKECAGSYKSVEAIRQK